MSPFSGRHHHVQTPQSISIMIDPDAEVNKSTQVTKLRGDSNDDPSELPYFNNPPDDDCSEYKTFINDFRDNRSWGYVVFRTVYGDGIEEEFKAAMIKLEQIIRESLEHPLKFGTHSPHPGERQALVDFIMAHYQNTIIEDESLENATISTLQERFNQWMIENERDDGEGYVGNQYFMVIDEECLQSISAAPSDAFKKSFTPEKFTTPIVKVVKNEYGSVSRQEAWWIWEQFYQNGSEW